MIENQEIMQDNKCDIPLVTIRCITYNHEPYIRQCLEGFVMQQTNFKFEAIVHDDASTDGTAAIVAEFAEKYPDIIKPLYETENQYSKRDGSLGRIMNAHTRGKYIAMCEGDDYWIDPLKLQKQVDFLEANPEYSATAGQSRILRNSSLDELFYSDFGIYKLEFIDLIQRGCNFHTSTFMYRRVLLNINSSPRVFSGDRFLFLACASKGCVYRFDDIFSVYRKHSGGVSSYVNLKDIERDLTMIEWFKQTNINLPIKALRAYTYKSIIAFSCNIRFFYILKYYIMYLKVSKKSEINIDSLNLETNKIFADRLPRWLRRIFRKIKLIK